MPYRIDGFADQTREALEAAREVDAVARHARARRARAALAVGAVVLGGLAGVVSLVALAPDRAQVRRRCHHVEIQWENAPSQPGIGWTACTESVGS